MANREVIENGVGAIGRFPPVVLSADGQLTEQQANWQSTATQAITDAINGQLSFGDATHASRGGNFSSQWIQQLFLTANLAVEVPHGLGRRPIDVWFGLPDKACRFYTDRRGSWNSSSIWVTCDTSLVTVPLLIF